MSSGVAGFAGKQLRRHSSDSLLSSGHLRVRAVAIVDHVCRNSRAGAVDISLISLSDVCAYVR